MTATPTADELFEEASGWYFRLQAEDVTPAEMENFAAWLGQGQAQDDAWQEVQALLGGLREPARVVRRAEQGEIGELPNFIPPEAQKPEATKKKGFPDYPEGDLIARALRLAFVGGEGEDDGLENGS